MGNNRSNSIPTQEGDDDPNIYDARSIYWDNEGNLRHGKSSRNRDDEVLELIQNDSINEENLSQLWVIVPSRWVRKWLTFASLKIPGAPEPGPVDMKSLIVSDQSTPGGWRPKNTLKPPSCEYGNENPGHYRRVSLEVWLKIVDLYDVNGYAVAVRGVPYDDISRWRVFKDPKYIDINLLPEPILPTEEEKEEEKKDEDLLNTMGSAMTSLIPSLGFGGTTAKKTT